MLLLIDNYDSFTYNLYQYLCELGAEVEVFRNDKIGLEDIDSMAPERIVISPGPCTPKEAGISVETIRRFAGKVPMLGVCLGHQCIGEAFGGVVAGAGEIKHGKMSHDHPRRQRRLRRPAQPVRGGALPLAGDRAGDAAGRAGGVGTFRVGRDHGRAPQAADAGGRAVPPGIDPDEAREAAAGELPEDAESS